MKVREEIIKHRNFVKMLISLEEGKIDMLSDYLRGEFDKKHWQQMIDYANGLEITCSGHFVYTPFFSKKHEYSTVKKMVKIGNMIVPAAIQEEPIPGTIVHYLDDVSSSDGDGFIYTLFDEWPEDCDNGNMNFLKFLLKSGMLFYTEEDCRENFLAVSKLQKTPLKNNAKK